MFADLPPGVTPTLRKRMKVDAAQRLPAHAQPSASQWKLILSNDISTCVVAGAGSGKSTSLVLRILFLVQYLGVPLSEISVVTFTRASREDFIWRLVKLFEAWERPLSSNEARACVTTFHAAVLAWTRSLPGLEQAQAFETLGTGKETEAFSLRVSAQQRTELNACYHDLMSTDAIFASAIERLRLQAAQLGRLPSDHPRVQRRLLAIQPAAERDQELTDLIEAQWKQAGHWPLPGIVAERRFHDILGQRFQCHGYLEGTDTWVILGAEEPFAERSRPGAALSMRAEWAVKRTLFQAFFDKPLIWLDGYADFSGASSAESQGPGIEFALAGESQRQPLLDAFVAMAGFVENLGLEVAKVPSGIELEADRPFFDALGRFWPAFEHRLRQQQPPVLTYNRMFGLFSSASEHLHRLPASRLASLRNLMVDEFQDISPRIANWLRAALAERLRRSPQAGASLVCVGDDWQSIYGWRGSSPSFFLKFEQVFPAPRSRRLKLKENFRSHQQIIDAAEFLVKFIATIPGKGAVAAGLSGELETLPRVQVHERNAEAVLALFERLSQQKASVLVLYRQAKDDPRKDPVLKAFLTAQEREGGHERQFRCMTIHGAKGLESDVVVLLGDCDSRQAPGSRDRLYQIAGLGATGDPAPYVQAQAEEALRLAYVAITRAAREVHWYLDAPDSSQEGGAAARAAQAPTQFERQRGETGVNALSRTRAETEAE
ncbi:UvrD-helicase domain-containing protein [Pseudomonas sp. DC3200b2]|uniref:UvrD-helicase domain-containing protein n=1 Tax=Pseudomonas sp. DC3200b2 TaxID=2804669 RepID=UPI003CEB5721